MFGFKACVALGFGLFGYRLGYSVCLLVLCYCFGLVAWVLDVPGFAVVF